MLYKFTAKLTLLNITKLNFPHLPSLSATANSLSFNQN